MLGRDAIGVGIEGRLFRLAVAGFLLALIAIKAVQWRLNRPETAKPEEPAPAASIRTDNR
jgi:hypothetical protein